VSTGGRWVGPVLGGIAFSSGAGTGDSYKALAIGVVITITGFIIAFYAETNFENSLIQKDKKIIKELEHLGAIKKPLLKNYWVKT
jgi:hypothetical protein